MTTVPPPPIIKRTTPFQTISPASVTTKEGSLKRVMISPWPMPIKQTTASAVATASGHGQPPGGRRRSVMKTAATALT